MRLKTRVVYAKSVDPWWNLAMEEYLLGEVHEDECILYLWQNQNTVVIGKNQNPWKECRIGLLEREGGKLARRISGGGAVFHDLGNLNFSFLVDGKYYDLSRQLGVILNAVKRMGIPAEFSGRNDLVVEGRKFSGNAFYFRKNKVLHHGTILVSTDIDKLTRYLQVSREKIRSKGVESVRSRVVNLAEYCPSLPIKKMSDAIVESFRILYGGEPAILYEEEVDVKVLKRLYEKYSSWNWRYGESPSFDVDLETRFKWGGIEIGLQLEKGRIKKAFVYSDAMDEAFIEMLPQALTDCPFHSQDMAGVLRDLGAEGERRKMIEDIAAWLEEKGF